MDRRRFLTQTGHYGLGFMGLQAFAIGCSSEKSSIDANLSKDFLQEGYGPLDR